MPSLIWLLQTVRKQPQDRVAWVGATVIAAALSGHSTVRLLLIHLLWNKITCSITLVNQNLDFNNLCSGVISALWFVLGDAFVLVYSIESRESYEEVLRLREQIIESIRSAGNQSGNNTKTKTKHIPIPMVIVGKLQITQYDFIPPLHRAYNPLYFSTII